MNKIQDLIVACALMFLIGINKLFAVPAYPYKVIVSDANGKDVEIYMRGDENIKYAMTLDGYTLLSSSDGWWYASITDDGKVIKSDFMLVDEEYESAELRRFKMGCPKGLIPQCESNFKTYKVSGTRTSKSKEPLVGERRALVILMQYQDLAFKRSREDFEHLFNALDNDENATMGSVRDYYLFASQGQLDYISDIYGPYTSKHPMRYYGANVIGGNDVNPFELCIEAIRSLPSGIDYSKYDNDGNGIVDNVHIIFAGHGEEAGGVSDAIWSHESPRNISLENEVGCSFEGYSCSPELSGNRGANITNIGVICHELGHALGAMDYYDTNYGTGGEYIGTGNWDIMASGSWNDDGRTPPNFNPYVRSCIFGWNALVTLSEGKEIIMPRMERGNFKETVVYKLETEEPGDYFLLENRQKFEFDAALPGQGLMIYHVHPDIDRRRSDNTINATHPQCLYPVCASYSNPDDKRYGNINTAECPFPGSRNVFAFSSETVPSAVAWDGGFAKVALSNIKSGTDGDMIVSIDSSDDLVDGDGPGMSDDLYVVYKEGFETDVMNRFSIYSIIGKEQWMQYDNGAFVMNQDFLPKPTEGDGMFMLHPANKASFSESEAIGPEIVVEPGRMYSMLFDIYCKTVPVSQTPYFSLTIEDGSEELEVYVLDKATDGWNSVELPLLFQGNEFRYKLYGRIHSGGIYIDNIKLREKESVTSNGSDIVFETEGTFLYRIDGTCLGEYDRYGNLSPGIYIIRGEGWFKKLLILK